MGIMNCDDEVRKSDEEQSAQKAIENHKLEYRKYMGDLKDTKGEIETIQKTLETTRNRMQQDFEKWLYIMMKDKGMVHPDGASTTNMGSSQTGGINNESSMQGMRVSKPHHNGRMVVPQVVTLGDSVGGASNRTGTSQVNQNSKVAKDIQDFYKARDEVYKNTTNDPR